MTDSSPSNTIVEKLRLACAKVETQPNSAARLYGDAADEIDRLQLNLQQVTLERDAMLEDIAALRMAESLNVETVARLQQERDRLEQCHREGWQYAKEVEDEYRKRTERGFGDPEPPNDAHACTNEMCCLYRGDKVTKSEPASRKCACGGLKCDCGGGCVICFDEPKCVCERTGP